MSAPVAIPARSRTNYLAVIALVLLMIAGSGAMVVHRLYVAERPASTAPTAAPQAPLRPMAPTPAPVQDLTACAPGALQAGHYFYYDGPKESRPSFAPSIPVASPDATADVVRRAWTTWCQDPANAYGNIGRIDPSWSGLKQHFTPANWAKALDVMRTRANWSQARLIYRTAPPATETLEQMAGPNGGPTTLLAVKSPMRASWYLDVPLADGSTDHIRLACGLQPQGPPSQFAPSLTSGYSLAR